VIVAVPIAGTIKGTIDAIRLLYPPKVVPTDMVPTKPYIRVNTEE